MTKDFEFVKKIVDETDWDELQKQKLEALTILDRLRLEDKQNPQIDALMGLVNWIESIQDDIVNLGYLPEKDVFGPPQEESRS